MRQSLGRDRRAYAVLLRFVAHQSQETLVSVYQNAMKDINEIGDRRHLEEKMPENELGNHMPSIVSVECLQEALRTMS